MIASLILALAATATVANAAERVQIFKEVAFSRADCYRFYNTVLYMPPCEKDSECKSKNQQVFAQCNSSVNRGKDYDYMISVSEDSMKSESDSKKDSDKKKDEMKKDDKKESDKKKDDMKKDDKKESEKKDDKKESDKKDDKKKDDMKKDDKKDSKKHNKKPTFNLGWNEIAFTEADCRRFQQTLEPKCNGNEACKKYNWGKYYECSKRVNQDKKNYNWVSRMALEADDDEDMMMMEDDEEMSYGEDLDEGMLLRSYSYNNEPIEESVSSDGDEMMGSMVNEMVERKHNGGKSFNLGWNEIAFTEADCKRFQRTLEPKCHGNGACKNYNWQKYSECSKRVNEEKKNYSWVSRLAMEDDEGEDMGEEMGEEMGDEDLDGGDLEYGDYRMQHHSKKYNLGWNEIAFTEADCKRFQKTLEPKCHGKEACKKYNWEKYYECSRQVNEKKKNYHWVSRMSMEDDMMGDDMSYLDEDMFDGETLEQGDY
ncbi:hypothetical protein HDU97_004312 [Phlyctochytrium planicorne]|nr:hypothetical protein HDU97_004312 [Phlyctochytrium planicorne]